jgi:hypothetical protein
MLLKEMGLVVILIFATGVGAYETMHSASLCLAKIERVAKLIMHGDPGKEEQD